MFVQEKRSILVESVSSQIREAIKNGHLKPGQRLIESDIAQEMKVGRNAIREALRYLEKEGLVCTIPFKGASVATLSLKEMENVYAVRIVLEELAINTLAKNMNAKKFGKLEEAATISLYPVNRTTGFSSYRPGLPSQLMNTSLVCSRPFANSVKAKDCFSGTIGLTTITRPNSKNNEKWPTFNKIGFRELSSPK